MVLEYVSTDMMPFSPPDDIAPRYVDFIFINTSGNVVHVMIENTHPVTVFLAFESHRGHPIPSADDLEQRETHIETIHLSAADAIEQTMDHHLLQDFTAIQEQVVVSTRLRIEPSNIEQTPGYPPTYWQVKYANRQGAEQQFMIFYLDARTGEIVSIALSHNLPDLSPDASESEK